MVSMRQECWVLGLIMHKKDLMAEWPWTTWNSFQGTQNLVVQCGQWNKGDLSILLHHYDTIATVNTIQQLNKHKIQFGLRLLYHMGFLHLVLWKNQSEWQRTWINGESMSMVWPTLGSRMAKEQNSSVGIISCDSVWFTKSATKLFAY